MSYKLSRTFQGLQVGSPEIIEFEFPVPETVSRYFISTNAVNWKLSGTNTYPTWADVDTKSFVYNLDTNGYTLNTPVTYKYFKFESNLVQNSNSLAITTLRFTNNRGYVLSPNLTSVSTFSNAIKSNPSILPQSGTVRSLLTSDIIQRNDLRGAVFEWNIFANVICTNIRFEPFQNQFTLLGSNNYARWFVLSENSNACTRLEPVSTFRLVTSNPVTTLRLFDSLGNDLTNESGGAYRGTSNTGTTYGEWLQVEYENKLPASVYSLRTVGGFYPTWWVISGSDNGTNWTTVDERSNVYDQSLFFSTAFQSGTVSYKYYRLAIKAFSGSTDARIPSFSIYDDRGTLLTPITTRNSFNPISNIIPTSSSNVITGPESPFIKNTTWLSQGTTDRFSIYFDVPVSVHKVYMETTSKSINITGDGVTLLETTNFNKVAGLTPLVPRNLFVFSNVGQNEIVSNVMIFGSDGNRLNPFFTSATTFNPSYGGTTMSPEQISISLPPNSSNGNLYSFVSHIASWKLEGNINGTFTTLNDVSNVYEEYVSYQSYFNNSNCTDYRLTIRETKPTEEQRHSVTMNCLQIFSNAFTPMIPTLTANITDVTDTIVSTSLIGQFSITCSEGQVPILNLFKLANDQDVTIPFRQQTTSVGTTQIFGSYIDVKLPYVKAVNYYQFTLGSDGSLAPASWRLVGSLDNGRTWSNVLSVGSIQQDAQPYQTTVYYTSNSTAFSAYRMIFGSSATLTQFNMFGNQGIITPDGSESSYGNELYGGQGNEWIQVKFEQPPAVSYIRLESTNLPSNIIVTADSRVVGRLNRYSNATVAIVPVDPLVSERTIRVYATEVVPNKDKTGRFLLSNIGFYDSTDRKLFKNFTPDPTQTDPLNQIITLSPSDKTFGGPAVTTPEKLTVNIYPNTSLGQYYVLRSNFAKKWTIYGSNNNSTWNILDTRNVTQFINDQVQRPYMFYNTSNTSYGYSWFRVEINETFPTSDGSININEFGVYDEKRRRILKFINENDTEQFMNTYSTGVCTASNRIPDVDGQYEYLWWKFDQPSLFSNATINIRDNAYMKSFKFIGRNTGDWSTIYESVDRSALGTFEFSGQIDDSPVKAFTTSGFCRYSTRASNVSTKFIQVDLPYPIEVGYYTVSMPSREELGAVVAGRITRMRLNNQETSRTIQYGSNAYIQINPVLTKSYRFEILETDIPSAAALLKNIILHDTQGYALYDTRSFSANRLIQTIEKPFIFRQNQFRVDFNPAVTYSNIAMIIEHYDRDPYQFDGRAQVSVSFQPTRFRGTRQNTSSVYDNDPTDIIEGSESVILGNESNRLQSASSYQFSSTNANVWSLFGSTDGQNWTLIEGNVSGSTTRTNVPAIPSAYYKLEINKITNNQDGTTNVSNFRVGDWPPLTLTSNATLQQTPVTDNSYILRNADAEVTIN